MKGLRLYAVVFIMISVSLLFSCMGNSGKNKPSGDSLAVSEKSIRIDGHRFVDLGLPSGLLWAETNIGAASEADAGE